MQFMLSPNSRPRRNPTIKLMKVETPPKAPVIPVIIAVNGVIRAVKLSDKVVNCVDMLERLANIWVTWACVITSDTEVMAFNWNTWSSTNWPKRSVWKISQPLVD